MDNSEKKWALSCYIPVFNIVFCLLAAVRKVNSSFCLFHMRQGLIIFAIWMLVLVVSFVSQTIGLMLWGVVLLLYISGLMVVSQGKETSFPLIGNLAKKIPPYYFFKLLTGKMPGEMDIVAGNTDQANNKNEEKPN